MLSIVIPCYNDAETLRGQLPGLVKYLSDRNIENEVIIVDDGSLSSKEIESVAGNLGCLFLSNKINQGKGAAIRLGMQHAKGDFRIYTDVDIPFQFESIEKFLHYLRVKEFDVVMGDRTLAESRYFIDISPVRKFGSTVFTFLVGRFVTTGLFDTQCGLKGFRAEIANDLFSVSRIKGFAFDVEILYVALKRNYDIKRLPVRLRCQEGSSVRLLRDGTTMLLDLFKIKWNHVFGRYKKRNEPHHYQCH